jgi:hypothetical protein
MSSLEKLARLVVLPDRCPALSEQRRRASTRDGKLRDVVLRTENLLALRDSAMRKKKFRQQKRHLVAEGAKVLNALRVHVQD